MTSVEEVPGIGTRLQRLSGADVAPPKGGLSLCLGIVMGTLLFPAALGLLLTNELNSVCNENLIMSIEDEVQDHACDDPEGAEGKPVFVSCDIRQERLHEFAPENDFGMTGLKDTVRFKAAAAAQKIEMYQCVETELEEERGKATGIRAAYPEDDDDEDSLAEVPGSSSLIRRSERRGARARVVVGADGALWRDSDKHDKSKSHHGREDPEEDPEELIKTYKYEMKWSDTYYDSKQYHAHAANIQKAGCPDFIFNGKVNHNPDLPDRGDGEKVSLGRTLSHATEISFGKFHIARENLLQKLDAQEMIDVHPFAIAMSGEKHQDAVVTKLSVDNMVIYDSKYLTTCEHDRLGCIRISYYKSDATVLSAVGTAGASGVLTNYNKGKNWLCPEVNFMKMVPGRLSRTEMIDTLRPDEDLLRKWATRIGGLLAAWVSLWCICHPFGHSSEAIHGHAASIPCCILIGVIFEGMVEMFVCTTSFSCGIGLGLLVLGIVWIALRPLVGLPLLISFLVLCCVGTASAVGAKHDPDSMGYFVKMEEEPVKEDNGEEDEGEGEDEDIGGGVMM